MPTRCASRLADAADPAGVPAVIVMFSPVTSIVGIRFASRIRCGEKSVTSPAVEWMWPASRSPTSSVSVMLPLVLMKICGRSIAMPGSSSSTGGFRRLQSTSVFAVTWTSDVGACRR